MALPWLLTQDKILVQIPAKRIREGLKAGVIIVTYYLDVLGVILILLGENHCCRCLFQVRKKIPQTLCIAYHYLSYYGVCLPILYIFGTYFVLLCKVR